ncbi:UNVERIFIED_CONTAM: Protein tyrosine phosphatase type IVA 2 [Gekko kuhli]
MWLAVERSMIVSFCSGTKPQGLRAPVLVALALIECGMKYEDAVQFIRQKRRGAFNSKQLLYLEKYRPKMRLRFRDANGHCIVQ